MRLTESESFDLIFAAKKQSDTFFGAKKSAENLIILDSIKGDFGAFIQRILLCITGFIQPCTFASEISLVCSSESTFQSNFDDSTKKLTNCTVQMEARENNADDKWIF